MKRSDSRSGVWLEWRWRGILTGLLAVAVALLVAITPWTSGWTLGGDQSARVLASGIDSGPDGHVVWRVAQGEVPPDAAEENPLDLDVTQFEGIEAAVARVYTGGALYEDFANDGGQAETRMLGINGTVMRFAEDDHATDAFAGVADLLMSSLADAGFTMDRSDVDDLGDEAVQLALGPSPSSMGAATETDALLDGFTAVIVRSDDTVRALLGVPLTGVALPVLTGLAKAMLDRDVGDGDVVMDTEGNASGGLFDRFPVADDPALTGLEPVADLVLHPVDG